MRRVPSKASWNAYLCWPGYYFLTFCTYEGIEAFRDPEVAATTLEQFPRTAAIEQFVILAYCLMPDHVHLLVKGVAATSDLRRFAKMAKQRSGGIHRRRCGVRLWQDGYFERVLRDGDDPARIARYIIENPALAGLPENYPHVGTASCPLVSGGSKKQDPPYNSQSADGLLTIDRRRPGLAFQDPAALILWTQN